MTHEKELYAPAQPFAQAIREWTQAHGTHHAHDHNRAGTGNGLEHLAAKANIPARSLRGYVNGERQVITLTNADRLALALGCSLWTLADEFGTKAQALERARHPQVPA